MEVPFLQNWKTRLQKVIGTLLDDSASVQQKLGNILFFIFVFLKQWVIQYQGFIITGKLKTQAKPTEGIHFIRNTGRNRLVLS